jgi:hypothetical protein
MGKVGESSNRIAFSMAAGHISLEKTAHEIYDLYERAVTFSEALPMLLASADVYHCPMALVAPGR